MRINKTDGDEIWKQKLLEYENMHSRNGMYWNVGNGNGSDVGHGRYTQEGREKGRYGVEADR